MSQNVILIHIRTGKNNGRNTMTSCGQRIHGEAVAYRGNSVRFTSENKPHLHQLYSVSMRGAAKLEGMCEYNIPSWKEVPVSPKQPPLSQWKWCPECWLSLEGLNAVHRLKDDNF